MVFVIVSFNINLVYFQFIYYNNLFFVFDLKYNYYSFFNNFHNDQTKLALCYLLDKYTKAKENYCRYVCIIIVIFIRLGKA